MARPSIIPVAGMLWGTALLVLDAAVVSVLARLGWSGMREIGGWGMLMVGIIVVAVTAANLLLVIVVLYRRAELSSESSQ